jgi:uncharacterized repeat protein (TIGR01451 family)
MTDNLEKMLKSAKRHEREYKWLEARKAYESVLNFKSCTSFLIAETWQSIGFCYSNASRQTETVEEFKRLRQQAVDAYKNAARFFEKEGDENHGKSAQCNFLAEFTRSWITSSIVEKKKTLDKCRTFGNKALEAFRKTEDETNYIKMCNNLLLCLFEQISIAPTQEEKQAIVREGICVGNEAISVLSNMPACIENKSELLIANSLISLHSWYAANINERPENGKELANLSLTFSEKAIELSNMIDNPYYIAMSRWAAALSKLYFTEKIESSIECAEEMLQQGVKVYDNYIKGIAYYLIVHIVDWMAAKESNTNKKKEYYAKIIRYSQDAAASLQLVSQDYYIAETYMFYTESYTHLGREIEIEIEGKQALLNKAVEIGRKGLEHAVKSGYPDGFAPALHSLSKALHFYANLMQVRSQKIKLLEEALNRRKEYIKIVESAFPSHTWSVGVGKNYAGLIEAELARLETDNGKKITLLTEAVSDMKEAISLCIKWVSSRPEQFGGSIIAVVAEFESTFGGVLQELYQLTKENGVLINAIEVYNSAARRFKKVKLPSRAAESYWKIARIQDNLGENKRAAKNFENAFAAYKVASRRLPHIVDYYLDHAVYMKAWSEIEKAKSAHKEKKYIVAMKKYDNIATLLKQTKLWNYLSFYFLGWSLLEQAENLSRKEQPTEAIQSFQCAMEHFGKAKEAFNNEIKNLVLAEEKDQAARFAKASFLKQRYCQARISLEKAKIFDRKGEYNQSSKSYREAREALGRIINELESEEEKKELLLTIDLSKAWEKMASAEEQESAEIYLEASQFFEQAKTHSLSRETTHLILGNSSFCKGLAAGVKYQITLEPAEYAKAKRYIKNAATNYLQAGFKSASEYAKGIQRLFDGYIFMNKAESEVDQEERAKQYQMAEKFLQISVSSFMKAKQPEKTAQVRKILQNVREERNIAVSLNEVLHGPTMASTPLSLSTPIPTGEASIGLERFEHANIQASLIADTTMARVGESICLTIAFVNVGKETALLTKVEDFVPLDFAVIEEPEMYQLENNCLNMRGIQLTPLKMVEVKLILQGLRKGVFQLKPKVHYFDELGQSRSLELSSLEIKIAEITLSNRVPTGTAELDSLLLGGIPEGYAVALTGPPSDKRSLLVKNFLEAGTQREQTTFHVTYEPAGLETLFKKPSFYLFVVNPNPKTKVADQPNIYKLRSKTDLNNLNIALAKAYRSLSSPLEGPKRACLEIVSDILLHYNADITRKWLAELINDLGQKGFTILAVIDSLMHPKDQLHAILGLLEGEISIIESESGLKCKEFVLVKKLRNQNYIKNSICLSKQ